ncbi:MAG: flagellar hook-associated protein FlgK [Sulfurimonas sp.]|nr:flagellar hook-associated protein FlgK [Sulfurimonas sp.]
MASIFNALNIGYSGLNAAQVGINTTGQNIANAEVDGYNRQRVIATAATPITTGAGNVGNGVEIQTIKRVFDNFVFDRYTKTYAEKEYTEFEKTTLEQLSTYFPEIDNVGIKADLQEYYNMWQTFADNPDNDSIKIALAKQTEVLADHISFTQNQVTTLQSELNDQLKSNVDQVNGLAKELAEINRSIDTAEAGTAYEANDLRDKRNVIERDLARLIGAETSSGQLEANIQIASNSNTKTGSYTVSINGFNLVDGTSFHPLYISNTDNPKGFYELSFEREDGVLIPMEENVNGGKIGSILNLRGGVIDTTSGVPKDGVLQNTIAELDAFAQGLIESTNNLYAQSATTRMDSNALNVDGNNAILSSDLNVNEGSFNLVVYDIDGNIVASREMKIDVATSIQGASGTNSIEAQMNANIDDNGDGSAGNDIDDYLNFNWASFADGTSKVEFTMDTLSESRGYTFAIEDKLTTQDYASGSNFAGALGMSRFFDGDSASNIDLTFEYKENPTLMSAGYSDAAGDNRLALNMIQHQFERYDHDVGGTTFNTTSYGMFDVIATEVGVNTNSAIIRSETLNAQFNAVELEYFSTSKVSIDEEMTNLIRYQTSYGAAAKVITTIDQMMQTLLGIKQ